MTKKRKAKVIEYNIEESPFYNTNVKLRATLEELKASEDGETVVLARKRYFKQDEYTKLIINDEFDILAYDELSSLAKTILCYVQCYCLDYNSPIFRLKGSEIGTILHRDISYIYKAIAELIANKDIARTTSREIYWINHDRYYKGNYIIDKFLKQK